MYGEFEEGMKINIQNPKGFTIPLKSNEAFRLNRVVYGCRQGAARFFVELCEFARDILKFTQSTTDPQVNPLAGDGRTTACCDSTGATRTTPASSTPASPTCST